MACQPKATDQIAMTKPPRPSASNLGVHLVQRTQLVIQRNPNWRGRSTGMRPFRRSCRTLSVMVTMVKFGSERMFKRKALPTSSISTAMRTLRLHHCSYSMLAQATVLFSLNLRRKGFIRKFQMFASGA